jgi:AraC-like DNA-binding protein
VAVEWPAAGGPGSGGAPERGRALRAVPDARARRIVELREAGWQILEIARELGLSTGWVAQVIDHAGGVDRERWVQARSELHLQRAQARRDEILARFRAGAKPPAIANELGLNQLAVWRIVRELATDADRSARAWALADHHQPRFSESELLDGLVRVAQRLGWVPSDAEYDRGAAELGLACSTTLYQRFGGWQGALEAAGLKASPARRWALRWDPDECWRALESVADQLGDPPRYRRYRELARGRDDLPQAGVVRNRLGLWSEIASELTRRRHGGQQESAPGRHGSGEVRRVAEIRPRVSLPARADRAIPAPSRRSFSDEQLAAGVRAVAESVGRTPTGGDYRRLAPTLALASHPTVCMRFGSWSGAVRAAGFEPTTRVGPYRRRWDAQACLKALDQVADELGDLPRYRDYEQLALGREDLPSGALLRQRLGPWLKIAAALRERRGGEDGVARALPEVSHAAA